MNYVWVESDSQTQSDTTTASYAAVPAVEQTVSLLRPNGLISYLLNPFSQTSSLNP